MMELPRSQRQSSPTEISILDSSRLNEPAIERESYDFDPGKSRRFGWATADLAGVEANFVAIPQLVALGLAKRVELFKLDAQLQREGYRPNFRHR